MAMAVKSRGLVTGALAGGLLLGGCMMDANLMASHPGDRAQLGDQALVPEVASTRPAGTVPPGGLILPPPVDATVRGTYTFDVPDTVTRLQRTTGRFDQVTMYQGRPAPSDTPFLVITVAPDAGDARAADAGLQPTSSRRYIMHGLIVDEWTGYTREGHLPFAQLLIQRPGGGDELYASAIAKDETQRQLAEAILGSIRWHAE